MPRTREISPSVAGRLVFRMGRNTAIPYCRGFTGGNRNLNAGRWSSSGRVLDGRRRPETGQRGFLFRPVWVQRYGGGPRLLGIPPTPLLPRDCVPNHGRGPLREEPLRRHAQHDEPQDLRDGVLLAVAHQPFPRGVVPVAFYLDQHAGFKEVVCAPESGRMETVFGHGLGEPDAACPCADRLGPLVRGGRFGCSTNAPGWRGKALCGHRGGNFGLGDAQPTEGAGDGQGRSWNT